MECRACRASVGDLVLDLGDQPACDYFPSQEDPGPDPVHPLQMWLCSKCSLAQLVSGPTAPEEPRGEEPAALIEQAAGAVRRLSEAGLLRPGQQVAEFGSPHGGSWSLHLAAHGLSNVGDSEQADVVLDCFGMMHCADQAAALTERVARMAPDGVLLLQFHSLATILRDGQWNALRHGHYAYYSITAVTHMLATIGLAPVAAWHFDLYGGTVLLAAMRARFAGTPTQSVAELQAAELSLGVNEPERLRQLQRDAESMATGMHDWLVRQCVGGATVYGYGAASRAVALLCRANVDRGLLPAIADSSRSKQGRRMPGTEVPIISPKELIDARPFAVLLFLSDLLPEVRRAMPQIEAAGGRWVDVTDLRSYGHA
jgi:hypothetical protein